MNPQPFPWQQALAIGLGVLRLSPDEFWKMTPREFAAALRGLYGDSAPPLDRAAFDALMARFPDHAPSSFETPASASLRRAPQDEGRKCFRPHGEERRAAARLEP